MSTRETLLAAVAATLSGVASGRVYRSRREQLPVLPAVIVTPSSESAEEELIGIGYRRLDIAIDVYASGDTPDTAADAVLAAAWAALAADPGLGLGSEVQLRMAHSIDWDFEEYDHVRATLRVTLDYRTTLGSM